MSARFDVANMGKLALGGTVVLVALASTFACNGSQSGATPDANTAAAAPGAGVVPPDAVPETWQSDNGPIAMLNSPSLRLRISASCKQPNNTFSCQAYTFAMQPVHVDITPADRARGASEGTIRCVKSHHHLVSAHDPQGNQDGFCQMDDNSLVAVGSIEARPNP